MKKIDCLMCGSKKSTKVHDLKGRKSSTLKQLKVVNCDDCGFMFMNPQPGKQELLGLYPDSLHAGKRASRLRFLKEWYEKQRLDTVLREAKRLGLKPDKILDIGCSNGFFLQLAKERGLKPYGTELSESQIKYLKQNVTKDVYPTEKELIGKEKFDVITAFDVIEHLPDPEAFLHNCSKLLKKGGLLVVMTMLKDSWTYRTFKDKVVWLCDQHLYYFSSKELEQLLERSGFEAYKKKTYNDSVLHLGMFAYQLMRTGKAEFADSVIFFAKKK